MATPDKDKIKGIIITTAAHLAVLLILFFWILRTVVPEEEGGILVNFGNINAAAGTFEPQRSENLPQQQRITPPQRPSQQNMLMQEDESVALAEQKKKEEDKKREEERRKADSLRLIQEINNQMAGAFGGLGEGNQSQGTAESGEGNQGSSSGNSGQGANEGLGGYGSFALDGRSIGAGGLPRPSYPKQIEGKIVISITVDPKGNVISAIIGRGTNIEDASMRDAAIEAAKKAKFNSIAGTNNQTGAITYNYRFR